MSTSGTVGQTVISVQQLIDHGARRAGKLAEELTSEQILASKDSLYYLLSHLANQGIQYWCIVKNIVGLNANEYIYYLPVGTVDVLNSNYRTMTNVTTGAYSSSGTVANAFDGIGLSICQLTTGTGSIGVVPGAASPVYMATIGILPAISGSVGIQLQYSYDNTTWVTVNNPGIVTWTAGQWLYYDLDPSATAGFWRINQTSGSNMGVYQVQFGTAPTEIPLARMNRDDYVNLPNKNFLSTRPLQYWFDRNIPQPAMYLWPTSNTIQPQIVAWCHRQIQDVGSLQGQLEIPQRWYLAIQNMLAHQMALELPAVDPGRIAMIKQEATETWFQAEQEERDKSPIYFAPNISPYTR